MKKRLGLVALLLLGGGYYYSKDSNNKTEEFKTWSAENVILYEVDSPRIKDIPLGIFFENLQLRSQIGVDVYPTVWILEPNKENKELGFDTIGRLRIEYDTKGFIDIADSVIINRHK